MKFMIPLDISNIVYYIRSYNSVVDEKIKIVKI